MTSGRGIISAAPSPVVSPGWNALNGARLIDLELHLRTDAARSRHRRTLVLAGDATWGRDGAEILLESAAVPGGIWLGDNHHHRGAFPVDSGDKLLGSECTTLVYDAHCGFDPDSFGAAVGALRAGGLLLLLVPALDTWPSLPDPRAARITPHPFELEQVGGRFLWRLTNILHRAAGVVIVEPDSVPPPVAESKLPAGEPVPTAMTADQERAIAAILATARGRARRPLVLTSDRGRGKTAALGIAAARLLETELDTILVTAPRRAAVEPVFRHAAMQLPGSEIHRNRIAVGTHQLRFSAPDAVLQEHPPAKLLLVDEAAGIPAPLLEKLLRHYGRIVFATTIHGYEGTGRGFDLRFRACLDRWTPGWHTETLETPIRWAPGDPLEALSFRGLLLDAAPAPIPSGEPPSAERLNIERLDRDALVRNEKTLRELFGLLICAHYQTRPMDLRHLLDGPDVEVHVVRGGHGHVIATLLATREGGLAPDLAKEIYAGRRRPRGHLLPQTLSAHAGLAEATGLRFLRVIRIAVHPAARRQQIGRRLLDTVRRHASAGGLDCIGASFGATADLMEFWEHCGFTPVHLGSSRNASSGAHAAVVLSPLTDAGNQLHVRAQSRLAAHLPVLLAGPLKDLEPEIVLHLLTRRAPREIAPELDDGQEIAAFAYSLRGFEATLPALHRFVVERLGFIDHRGILSQTQVHALVRLVLQHQGWSDTAAALGLSGRRECVEVLRKASAALLKGVVNGSSS